MTVDIGLRPPSCARGNKIRLADGNDAMSLDQIPLDASEERRPYARAHHDEGGLSCVVPLLNEVIFGVSGAARWIGDGDANLAQAVQTAKVALADLTVAVELLTSALEGSR